MRTLTFGLFIFTSVLTGQAPAPQPLPEWFVTLQKLQQELHRAPIGSLDARVESAWRSAIANVRHPQFATAAQIVAALYQSQGYERKAEQLLRHALALVPADSRRGLNNSLASHFEMAQQLTKALTVREALANDRRSEFAGDLAALAGLYEKMGELEKAEVAWKEISSMPRPSNSRQPASFAGNRILSSRMAFAYGLTGPDQLASFYARAGRIAEAEQIYRELLEQANSTSKWSAAAQGYLVFLMQQRRFEDGAKHARELVARAELSSEPEAPQIALNARRILANVLSQSARPEEALAVERKIVEQLEAQGPANHFMYISALESLADTLISLNHLEEAERVVAKMRDRSTADPRNVQFHESAAARTLAHIRARQNRPEEAARLRASSEPQEANAGGSIGSVHAATAAAQKAAQQGDLDRMLALVEKALAAAEERAQFNPQEAASVIHLAPILNSKGREKDARQVALAVLRMLDQASPPDHPRVGEALGSIVSALESVGMATEAEQVIARMEKILLDAKGPDSPSLDALSQRRIARMQKQSDHAGALEELKKILARTEERTGPKSRESLHALRAVAWAHAPLNNWAEEEAVCIRLLERTVHLSGKSNLEHAHLLEHIANRASQNGQLDSAIAWIARAIEIVRALPQAEGQLSDLIARRAQFQQQALV